MFTCGGRRVALLEAFRRAMGELSVTGKLLVTDITDTSPAFHRADEGLLVPSVGRIEYIPALLEVVQEHRVGLIVPLTDLDLRSLSRQQAKFSDLGCQVMVGPQQTIEICRDKSLTSELLATAGVSSIPTFTLPEFWESPFYPCFVKPIRGSAGVGTGVIKSAKQLRAHVATFGDFLIVQQYVPGPEFTIDVYRSRDGQVRSVVPRQRLVVRSGEVEKGITVKDDEIIAATVKVAGLLEGMWGVFCCQCRRDDDGQPRFFEINPRFGGGVPLSIAAGADLPLYLLQEVLGLPITAEMGQFTDRLLMMRYDQAVFHQVDDPSQLPGYDQPFFH